MAYLLMIAGILLMISGISVLIRIFIAPFRHEMRIVLERKDDYVFYETPRGKRLLKRKTKQLITECTVSILIGIMLFSTGMYLGYAARGTGFWPYKVLFGNAEEIHRWDKLNKEGKFVSSDGVEYSYYIVISGETVSMCGAECEGTAELDKRLSEINRENTVILIDSFADAATVHLVEEKLNNRGIYFKMETE